MSESARADKPTKVSARQWVAVFGAILGAFMAILDIQITNSSLSYIQGGLAASLDEGTWISTGYLVAEIVIIPLTGFLSQVFGLRRFLLINVLLFVGFSILCGTAGSLIEMILFRVGQGLTGGVLIPTALTVVNTKLPPERRATGSALFGLTLTIAPALGPTLGGWLTDNFGWPYIFYINIVPGILMFGMIWYGLEPEKIRLSLLKNGDWLGIAAMAIGLGSLEIVLEEGERHDWLGSPMIRNLAIVAAVFTTTFIIIELTRKNPVINLRLLKQRSLGASCFVGMSMGLALFGSIYIIPVYLTQVQGYDAEQIGEVIMWLGLPQLLIFPLVPLLSRRIDPRILLAFGLLVFAASNFMNTTMSHDTAAPQLRWVMIVRAIGQPFVMAPVTQMALAGIRPADAANASSLFNMMRNLGGSMGIALLQTFATWREHYHFDIIAQRLTQNNQRLQDHLTQTAQLMLPRTSDAAHATQMALANLQQMVRREAFVMAYSDCFYVMGVVLLVSILLTMFMAKPSTGTVPAH